MSYPHHGPVPPRGALDGRSHERQVHPALAHRGDIPHFRPVKYSLSPPLGLATLAAYRPPSDHAEIVDEQTFPIFLEDLGQGEPWDRYTSTSGPTLVGVSPIRRDLIQRALYLVPNSIVVSRSCPDRCGFCYRDSFFTGGKGYYTQVVDDPLAEIERLPGKHLYFLDDYILGNPRFARGGCRGGRHHPGCGDADHGRARYWRGRLHDQDVQPPGTGNAREGAAAATSAGGGGGVGTRALGIGPDGGLARPSHPLEAAGGDPIETVHGLGYRLRGWRGWPPLDRPRLHGPTTTGIGRPSQW